MMTLAELNGDRIAVHTEYRDRDLIRAVPGARYDPAEYKWHVPLSWAGCLTLRGLFRGRLEIGPRVAAWAFEHRDQFVAPAMLLRTATTAEPIAGAEVLYDFQTAGVRFLSHVKHALL